MSKEAEEFEGNLLDLNNKKATDRYLMDRYEFAQAYVDEVMRKRTEMVCYYCKGEAEVLITGYCKDTKCLGHIRGSEKPM